MIFGLTDMDTDFIYVKTVSYMDKVLKINPEHSVTDVRKHFISQRIVKIWNELSPTYVDFTSLKAFKKSSGRCNFSTYVMF